MRIIGRRALSSVLSDRTLDAFGNFSFRAGLLYKKIRLGAISGKIRPVQKKRAVNGALRSERGAFRPPIISIMEFVFLFAGIVVVLVALAVVARLSRGRGGRVAPSRNAKSPAEAVTCPVCGTPLGAGENLRSKIFRPMNTPDQRMTVQGCPHCFPSAGPGIERRCPVCGRRVPPDGELVARLFNRPGGKKHVMVTGCSECCRRR